MAFPVAAVMAGATLVTGLLAEKQKEEQARRQRILEALQSGTASGQAGIQSTQQGQAQALGQGQSMLQGALR